MYRMDHGSTGSPQTARFTTSQGFGNAQNNGNGGPAIDAPPSDFIALAADGAGNLYTEESNPANVSGNFIIRRIGADGIINVVAGSFTATSQGDGPALQAELVPNAGFGLMAESDGAVTFAEAYLIRQLTTQSTIKTLAPTSIQMTPDGTPALNAWFIGPTSIALDHGGNLYVADACAIREIDAAGVLSTVAVTGKCSNTPPSAPALATDIGVVVSIAADNSGQVFFADYGGSVYMVSAGVISKIATIENGGFPRIAVDSGGQLYFLLFLVFSRGSLRDLHPS